MTGKSHISWENLWFPVDFPINQPIDSIPSTTRNHSLSHGPISTERYLGSPILESVENKIAKLVNITPIAMVYHIIRKFLYSL